MNPCRKGEALCDVECICVVDFNSVAIICKSQGIISTRSNFDNTVDGEILGVVFKIVPSSGHNIAHVCAGDVDIALIIAGGRLVCTPVSVVKWSTIVPSVRTVVVAVIETGP